MQLKLLMQLNFISVVHTSFVLYRELSSDFVAVARCGPLLQTK